MKSSLIHYKFKLAKAIILCMMAGSALHAQVNIVKAEYFIDTDPGFGLANNISITAATNITDKSTSIPLTNVANGFHILFLRSKDANNIWSITNKLAFYKTTISGNALANITRAEYFVDTDPGFGSAVNIPLTAAANIADQNVNIPLGNIAEGFHILFVRSLDANGRWSITNKLAFYKTTATGATLPNIVKAEYFIDADPGFDKATNITVAAASNIADKSSLIPLSDVADGFHILFVRSKDANGRWSVTNKLAFFKTKAAGDALPNIVKTEYFIDADPGFGKAINIPLTAAANISDNSTVISLSGVADGFHNLLVRSKDLNGKWSITNKLAFFKTKPIGEAPPNLVACEYFFNSDPGFGKGVPVAIATATNIPDFISQVNITNLTVGTHRLFIRSKDVNGSWSVTNVIEVPIAAAVAAQVITINGVSSRNLCSDQQFNLSFDVSGSFNNGNIFTAQLSDANGSFTAPLILGNVTATRDSIIKCLLPLQITNSSGYKIRIVSSSPVVTGNVTDPPLTILDQPRFRDTAIIVICQTDKFNLTTIYNTGLYTIAWSTGTPTAAPIGTHQMFASSSGKCKDTAIIIVKQDIATWTGATSKNWHIASNWSTGKIPSLTTHVIIPSGTPNICELSVADVNISSLQVKPGGVINVINNRLVNIGAHCSTLPPG